jgi:His-Xaa-Ser system protein HxsD
LTDASEPSGEAVDFRFELAEREVAFELDESLYPLDAIYGASYLFVDRCYVFLLRPADRRVRVRLRTREAASPDALEALAGEFANELLNQALRRRISDSTRTIREYYMARAFFGNESRATIDALLAELDSEEMKEDALEVPVPWERPRG